jgi:hypothetical protein
MYAHAQGFAASDELLLDILKAFILQPLNKQQTIGFHVFWLIQCDSMQNIITTPTVHSTGALITRCSQLLDVFSLFSSVTPWCVILFSTNSSPLVHPTVHIPPATYQSRPPPRREFLVKCGLYTQRWTGLETAIEGSKTSVRRLTL